MRRTKDQTPRSANSIEVLCRHLWNAHAGARLGRELPPSKIRKQKNSSAIDLLTPGFSGELIAYLETELSHPLGVQHLLAMREQAVPELTLRHPSYICTGVFLQAIAKNGLVELSDRALLHLFFHIEIFGALHSLLLADRRSPYWEARRCRVNRNDVADFVQPTAHR